MTTFFLSGFQVVLPRFKIEQQRSLEWLAAAHALGSLSGEEAAASESQLLLKLAQRFGCGPEKIAVRYHEPQDFQEIPSKEGLVFAPLSRRMDFYT